MVCEQIREDDVAWCFESRYVALIVWACLPLPGSQPGLGSRDQTACVDAEQPSTVVAPHKLEVGHTVLDPKSREVAFSINSEALFPQNPLIAEDSCLVRIIQSLHQFGLQTSLKKKKKTPCPVMTLDSLYPISVACNMIFDVGLLEPCL